MKSTASLDKARSDAQNLHRELDAASAKLGTAVRADLGRAAVQARELSTSLKASAETQRDAVKQHLDAASEQMRDAAEHARDAAKADGAKLAEMNLAMRDKVRNALSDISAAIAAQRTSTKTKV